MKERPDLSLVIACYNEAGHLEDHIRQILKIMGTTRFKYEIIFVDDGSSDGTRDIICQLCDNHKMMSYIFHEKNEGRGKAVSDGIKKAEGKVVGFIDIDLETHARYIPWLVAKILEGADIACAHRIYEIRLHLLVRWILNRGYNFLVRNFLGLKLMDTETGCKFFNREKILPVLEEVEDNHWFWDTEIIARAYFRGLKIVEVPTLYVRRKDRKSTVKVLPDTIYYLKKLFWFKYKLLRGSQVCRVKKTSDYISRGKIDLHEKTKTYWKKNGEYFERYYDKARGISGFIINAFLKKRMSKVLSLLNISSGKKILDLGCGSGHFFLSLSKMGAKVTGLDYSHKLLTLSKNRLKEAGIKEYNLILADASSIPIKDSYYDFVICIGVLDCVLDIRKVIKEVHRVLKDSGVAVITIPKKITPFFILRSKFGRYLRRALFDLPPILTAVTKPQLLKIVDVIGFKVDSIAEIYHTMWIFSLRYK